MGGRASYPIEKIQNLTDKEWAYIAGFFDGEGSISISYSPSSGKPFLQVAACQNRPQVLLWLHSIFDGTLNRDHGHTRLPNGEKADRATYRWKITGELVTRHFLSGMKPYAIVKREEIAEALFVLDNKHSITREDSDACRERMKQYRQFPRAVEN